MPFYCLPKGRPCDLPHEKGLICAQHVPGVGWVKVSGVGHVMVEWVKVEGGWYGRVG